MLVLTRKIEEEIRIGDDITISILRVKGNTVRVGIEAPRSVRVVRGELPPHARTETAAHGDATSDADQSESAAGDDGTPHRAAGLSVPATSAVRQFLASRAQRRNGAAKSHRSEDHAAVTTLTRSA